MSRQKAKRYPHRDFHAFTRRGFRQRVIPRLLREGWKVKEVEKLEKIYFCTELDEHIDDSAMYRNVKENRLYKMARGLKADRKRPIFELVIRSKMFDCYFDDNMQITGFISPYCRARKGVMVQ